MKIQDIVKAMSVMKLGTPKQMVPIAAKVARTGRAFSVDTVSMLIDHFTACQQEPLSHTLEALDNGSWVGLVDDLASEQAREDEDERRSKDAGTSGMRWVSENNPYGWAKPELKGGQDIDTPGAWNPFRQCFNLTVEERREAGTRDHRRRGCSRFEVLGCSADETKGWRPGKGKGLLAKERAPKTHYDPLEVARAQGMPDPGEPAGKVYGE